jgi:hypothetical protein
MPPPPPPGSQPPAPRLSLLREGAWRWALASVAAAGSELLTYPLDFVKTRLQLQNELVASARAGGASAAAAAGRAPGAPPPAAALGMFALLRASVRAEGWRAPFAGASVACARQVFNAGVSIALYPAVRGALLSPGEGGGASGGAAAPLWKRAAAGAATGALGQALANPFDVVKVRLQADGRARARGLAPRYAGPADAVARIAAAEGAAGFYAAFFSSVYRAAIINAAGIASYDHTKQAAVAWLDARARAGAGGAGAGAAHDSLAPQAVAALVCGFVSAVVSAPLDVVKTRLMADPSRYRGPNDALLQLVRTEGAASLYKGFVPTYQRQAIFNFVFWLALEELQRATGAPRL